jgi:hypothetical protein
MAAVHLKNHQLCHREAISQEGQQTGTRLYMTIETGELMKWLQKQLPLKTLETSKLLETKLPETKLLETKLPETRLLETKLLESRLLGKQLLEKPQGENRKG